MGAITKEFLSASVNGKPKLIGATAFPGTHFHSTPGGQVSKDEVTLYFSNTHTAEVDVTVGFGGEVSPNETMRFKVPPGESILGVPGIPLNNGLSVTAFASVANVVTVFGFVNRIS